MNANILVDFFKGIVTDLENDNTTDKNIKTLTDFMLSYKFQIQGPSNENKKDFIKFLTMGWYIYSQINEKNDNLK